MQRVIAQLPREIRSIHRLFGPSHVLACTDEECVEIDVETARTTPFVALTSPAAGAGGWDDLAFVVERNGIRHVRYGAAGAHVTTTHDDVAVVRTVVAAQHDRIVARVAAYEKSFYRTDQVEVLDVGRGWARVGSWVPRSRDCIEIDVVAFTSDGGWLGMTGLDIRYSSAGDWATGQRKRAFFAPLAQGSGWIEPTLELGESWSPRERAEIPLALGSSWWLVGERAFRVDDLRAIRASAPIAVEKLRGRLIADDSLLAAAMLDGDRFAALTLGDDMVSPRLRIGHPGESEESDVEIWPGEEYESRATALAGVGAYAVVGLTDGRILRIDRRAQ